MGERTWMGRAQRVLGPALAMAVVLAAVGACGVSASGPPVKIGDKISVPGDMGFDDAPKIPFGPDNTSDPAVLVRYFLKAAAGGADNAPTRLQEFLTEKARNTWQPPTVAEGQTIPLTVIRIIDTPVTRLQVNGRYPVEIKYQVVGSLNDDGLVSDLPGDSSVVHDMTFYVVLQPDDSLRIDQVEGNDLPMGPWLSDDALTDLYRPQTIYFWDATNTHLIPDVRYLPLTLGRDQRAQRIVQWLLDAPSPWLTGAQFAQRLPSGAAIKEYVTNSNGTWTINLSAASGAGGAEAVRNLYYQLQSSLRSANTTPSINLKIEGQPQPVPGNEGYLKYNLFNGLSATDTTSFDIDGDKVVALSSAGSPPNVLKSAANANVAYAAVNRAGTVMALVHNGTDGKRTLQLVRDPDGAARDAQLPRNSKIGRPIFIPGTDVVLVPSNGHLWLVQPDGSVSEINLPRRGYLSSVSVSPDGRRIAWVVDREAYVAPLMPNGATVSIGANPRAVLPNQLNATAIAWTGEAWLYVVGTSASGGPAMFRTTVDSAVAQRVPTDKLTGLPIDVVALATAFPINPGQVLVFTPQGRFTFSPALSTGNDYKNPFYVI